MPIARPGRWEVGVLLRDLSARGVLLMGSVAGWVMGAWKAMGARSRLRGCWMGGVARCVLVLRWGASVACGSVEMTGLLDGRCAPVCVRASLGNIGCLWVGRDDGAASALSLLIVALPPGGVGGC